MHIDNKSAPLYYVNIAQTKGVMKMLFKREILITRDLNECNRIRDILSNHSIETTVSTGSKTNPGRYHGIPFIDASTAYEHRVYVKRKEYDRAKEILRK